MQGLLEITTLRLRVASRVLRRRPRLLTPLHVSHFSPIETDILLRRELSKNETLRAPTGVHFKR